LLFDPTNEPLKGTIHDLNVRIARTQNDGDAGPPVLTDSPFSMVPAQDMIIQNENTACRSFAPTPASFDGILDDVPFVAPTPLDYAFSPQGVPAAGMGDDAMPPPHLAGNGHNNG